jgi:uncharacterized protein
MALRKMEEECHHDKESFTKKILMVLVAVTLVYLTLFLGTLMRNNLKKYQYIGQAEQAEHTIAINGTGKVSSKNDLAVTTVGFSNVDKDVAKAQEANRKVMDPLMKELKSMGIEEKDLQSNYTIYPEYDYSTAGTQLRGFRVTNNVTIKIRDLTKITAVLGLPSKYGANEVSGLSFTIDDPENLRTEARTKAVADAKNKAKKLAESLGVTLGEVVSYSDYDTAPIPPIYYGRDMAMVKEGLGMGGPTEIATGTGEISTNVTIVYRIYPKYRW